LAPAAEARRNALANPRATRDPKEIDLSARAFFKEQVGILSILLLLLVVNGHRRDLFKKHLRELIQDRTEAKRNYLIHYSR